jgi:hypothetical protein
MANYSPTNYHSLQPVAEVDDDATLLRYQDPNPRQTRPQKSKQASPTSPSAPSNPLFKRNGYQRMPPEGISLSTFEEPLPPGSSVGTSHMDDLGILDTRATPFPRVPVGRKTASPSTPRSSHGLLSTPPSSSTFSPSFSPISPPKMKLPRDTRKSSASLLDATPLSPFYDIPAGGTGDPGRDNSLTDGSRGIGPNRLQDLPSQDLNMSPQGLYEVGMDNDMFQQRHCTGSQLSLCLKSTANIRGSTTAELLRLQSRHPHEEIQLALTDHHRALNLFHVAKLRLVHCCRHTASLGPKYLNRQWNTAIHRESSHGAVCQNH